MGFVSGLLGTAGGGGGSGYAAPQGASPAQLGTAYNQTQQGIAQQQAFVNALQQQGGLANQASVFGQQQDLANQLQGVANGQGPNPAQAALAQNTGTNVSNQAALMAGQRGSNANAGLIARQAAQQGAATQQQAVGQGATLQAQQSLAAMQQLQNQQASMGNMANTQIGQQQTGLQNLNQNSLQQQQNLLGMQGNINNANANLTQTTMGGQQNMLGNMMGGIGSLGSLFGGGSSIATTPGATVAGGAGDIGGGAADIGSIVAAEGGRVPKRMADGGEAFDPLMQSPTNQQVSAPQAPQQPSGPQSNVGKAMAMQYDSLKSPSKSSGNPMSSMMSMAAPIMQAGQKFGGTIMNGVGDFFGGTSGTAAGEAGQSVGDFFSGLGSGITMAGGAGDATASAGAGEAVGAGIDTAISVAAKGGKVPALLSPGERYLPPSTVKAVAQGKADPMRDGKKVPGKPKVGGAKNSYANDTVKASLDEGGIVIPRSITQGKNPHWAAHKFVSAIMAKNGQLPKRRK